MAETVAGFPPPLDRRPTKAELLTYVGATVADLLPDPLRLLFVGINPGLWTAAVDAHFARPGNRFWPALHRAGILPHVVDVSRGMAAADRALLVDRGIGITNMVPVASARADELTREQVRAGAQRLVELVNERNPRVVAVLGVTSYRTAFARPRTRTGLQEDPPPGVRADGPQWWVLPNPSGLNAHDTVDSLAAAYRRAAVAAGVLPVTGADARSPVGARPGDHPSDAPGTPAE
ncbi:mismatch-specific DNA-glycosylase [Nakamurella flava]|uniref:Mismatch-specific DNA-glycosylase n=1 Tax=Nakamurella flava TaxID=2576308 RepID=A0A4U6QEK3_9ACTN|nr:mismatch-specific DNA-glycosylase [Nakamurella flava]TKV58583.1 mismatch-specific DNA-glycosylase [Nakamurella flava]